VKPLALLLLLAALTEGCASAMQQAPARGTFWGYVAESPTERRVLVSSDRGECERVRQGNLNRPATVRTFSIPSVCRQFVLGPGSDYWIVPALYMPDGSYVGAATAEGCAAMNTTQSRDSAVTPWKCQPVGVRVVE
jgi:hypothetical protein